MGVGSLEVFRFQNQGRVGVLWKDRVEEGAAGARERDWRAGRMVVEEVGVEAGEGETQLASRKPKWVRK